MKKASLIICALILAVFFFAGNSFAMALGAYIDFGGGTGEAEYDYEGAEEFDYDTGFFGVGFQFETSPQT